MFSSSRKEAFSFLEKLSLSQLDPRDINSNEIKNVEIRKPKNPTSFYLLNGFSTRWRQKKTFFFQTFE
jgi:hypothetical protein